MASIPSIDAGEPVAAAPAAPVRPCLGDVVTEDDTPVDNMFSEKQHRLLTKPLSSSWQLPCSPEWLPVLELGRTLWRGPFENCGSQLPPLVRSLRVESFPPAPNAPNGSPPGCGRWASLPLIGDR